MSTSFGFVSTYPDTPCGIATYSRSLSEHLEALGVEVGVVRLVERPTRLERPVIHAWETEGPPSDVARQAERAARALDPYDVVLLQHEYGIFGGDDGEDVLQLVRRLRLPLVTVAHTVLSAPTPHQRKVLDAVVAASDAVVTMTRTAHDRLVRDWGVPPEKVHVIAHGAPASFAAPRSEPAGGEPTILTWGLLSPGKGIEWAIMAMADLRERGVRARYRVVGQTHPRVLEHHGDVYRHSLEQLVHDLGLPDVVEFDPRYLDAEELGAVVAAADVVLLPYDSLEQVTSGVLVEAVAAGKPVVATRFPHAVELLEGGVGGLVPRRNPAAAADALQRVLSEHEVAGSMAASARELSASLLWPVVATQHLALARSVAAGSSRGGPVSARDPRLEWVP
ncbi:glycosyltransferase [Serinibacter arcticus]|uniref:Glycosyltransferase n=1 Tax=Serinibacter arcticus TaxID=1655435 RepID=A0A4Z1E0L1_9MICO|nr:glycosyltransferase [Serinibacter arcticus]TGO05434.1 Glycosyltransferase [Serinibacter arcticus]